MQSGMSFATRRYFTPALLIAAALLGCSKGGTTPLASPRSPSSAQQQTLYRKAFPQAARFAVRDIPKEMIRSANKGNDRYLEAYDAEEQLLGYLRDLYVPVTLGQSCPCDPLDITLAFEPDLTLKTLLSKAPLSTRDHEPMSEQQFARLLRLAKAPPPQLQEVKNAENLVDHTTGATKAAYASVVVPRAALSTHRVVGLVRDTRRLLQGIPMARDEGRLKEILSKQSNSPRVRSEELAEFLGSAQHQGLRAHAFQAMVRDYISARAQGAPESQAVQQRALDPKLQTNPPWLPTRDACQHLADANLDASFVGRCVEQLRERGARPEQLGALEGTLAYHQQRMPQAFAALTRVAQEVPIALDPHFHLRLGEAEAQTGRGREACERAKKIFADHPRLPKLSGLLQSCGDAKTVNKITTGLRKSQHRALRRLRRSGDTTLGTLDLEDASGRPSSLVLKDPKRITVVFFFATWCPHCQAELPELIRLKQALQRSPRLRDRVRLVGVRTSVERETTSYEEFLKTFQPNFPIYTDPLMSLVFSKVAKDLGVPASFPKTLVLDQGGGVRYLMPFGPYRDVARELLWAVNDLLGGGADRDVAQLLP